MGGGEGLLEGGGGACGGAEGTANCCWLTCTMLAELTLTPAHPQHAQHQALTVGWGCCSIWAEALSVCSTSGSLGLLGSSRRSQRAACHVSLLWGFSLACV